MRINAKSQHVILIQTNKLLRFWSFHSVVRQPLLPFSKVTLCKVVSPFRWNHSQLTTSLLDWLCSSCKQKASLLRFSIATSSSVCWVGYAVVDWCCLPTQTSSNWSCLTSVGLLLAALVLFCSCCLGLALLAAASIRRCQLQQEVAQPEVQLSDDA